MVNGKDRTEKITEYEQMGEKRLRTNEYSLRNLWDYDSRYWSPRKGASLKK